MPTMGGEGFDAGMNPGRLRVNLVAAWAAVQLLKLLVAARLPLFVDEAFYAWEARHPAWAYSDLPGLTAWLAHLGLLGGDSPLALRLPFIVLGATVPWLVWCIARRVADEARALDAAWLALLMPLSGWLGVLAVPDVALVVASLLCAEAVLALRERVTTARATRLALGLAVGALAHYRFGLVLLAGGVAITCDPRARAWLRHPLAWLALALGALAWAPALHWNLANAEAGLRFHLVDRNPWQMHAGGLAWLPVQALLVTPPLLVALLVGSGAALRQAGGLRLLAIAGVIAAPALLPLAFFVDAERVSFHWPLGGWLLLLPLAAIAMARWASRWRVLVFMTLALGLLATTAFLAAASSASMRAHLADSRLYPADVAGGPAILADARGWPRDRPWIAGDFELAAQLAFADPARDIRVLDSPLNRKHGRAVQLALWGVDRLPATGPVLLAIEDSATPMKHRLVHYHALCSRFGPLPPARVVSADQGRKRYFVYLLDLPASPGPCIAPALSYIDAPAPRQAVSRRVEASGWAFKEGVGLRRVEVLVDGRAVARAAYGAPMPGVAAYWRVSTDPHHPRVGWRASLDLRGLPAGRHWMGLRLHGADGSVEDSPQQSFRLGDQGSR
jgi:hypothetical protein